MGGDEEDPVDMSDVLECREHVVAASGVLDQDFLREAQRLLGCARLVVALPSQNALWAAPADLPAERLDTLARLVMAWNDQVANPVTPLLFYATDGIVDGVEVGAELSLSETLAEVGDDSQEGPLIPVLEPLDWQHTTEHETDSGVYTVQSIAVPFHVAGRQVGFLAFGREWGSGIQIRSADIGVDAAQLQTEALTNLAQVDLGWQPIHCSAPVAGDGEVETWLCNDTAFASSGVLNRSVLLDAHRETGLSRLVVAFPSREVLLVASADDPAVVATFARLMARWYEIGHRPISHLTFYCADGVLDRVYPDSDHLLEEVQVSGVAASIFLAFPGDPPDVFEVGDHRIDNGAIPWDHFQERIDSGDAEGIEAILGVGLLLADNGDSLEAARAFRMALDSAHPEYAADAGLNLGKMLQHEGDLEGARQAYRRASDFGRAAAAQEAAFWLGQLLDEQGDAEGACAAWRMVTDPESDWYAGAAQNLGVVLKQQGDREGAAGALRRAVESDDPDVSPAASPEPRVRPVGDGVIARARWRCCRK